MARTGAPNSAGSQFFLSWLRRPPHLDGAYAAFGRVAQGLQAADEIAAADRDHADRPVQEQRIVKMTVNTFGAEYPEPEKNQNRR